MSSKLKRILFILAPKDFRDEEFFGPRDILDKNGFKTEIANSTGTTSRGVLGGRAEPNLTLDKVSVNDYDAVVFVGGAGCTVYFNNKKAINIAKEAYFKGRLVCSICLATGILANAGLLRDKKATGFSSTKEMVEKDGGIFTGKDVEISGRIITASGPKSAAEFGRTIANELKKDATK